MTKTHYTTSALHAMRRINAHLERINKQAYWKPALYRDADNTLKQVARLADSAFVAIHLSVDGNRLDEAGQWLDRLGEHMRIANEIAADTPVEVFTEI